MKTCQLIEDLYPLYEENLLQEASKEFVEKHLQECSDCRTKFSQPQHDIDKQAKLNMDFMAKSIRKEKKKYGWAVFFLGLGIIIWLISFLTKPIPFEYSTDLFEKATTDQQEFLIFKPEVSTVERSEDSNGIYVSANTSLWRKWFQSQEQVTIALPSEKPAFYANQKSDAVQIAGTYIPGNLMILPRLALNFYMVSAVVSLAILLFLFLVFKDKISKKIKIYLSAVPSAFILGFLSIKGLNGASHYIIRDLSWIMLLALCYYLAFVAWYQIKNSRI